MFEVSVEASFSAGHALRNYQGKCENLHGHNYRVRVSVAGDQLDNAGLLVDFSKIKASLRALVERLDHQFLNELKPFDELNPSAENLAKYISDGLSGELQEKPFQLGSVTVWETDTTSVTYRPPR
ncbi:MAG: 6-carboxytetrahydropterin synthase QueD [Terriglobia bacterium]